jgi:AraC-like DNA-binding protein
MTNDASPKLDVDVLAQDYPARFDIAAHAHDAHQVVHARAGIMRVMTDAGAWVVPPGRALWMPRRRTHWIHCVTAVSMRTVYLRGEPSCARPECEVWAVSPLLRELILRLVGGVEARMAAPLLELMACEIERVPVTPLHLPKPADRRLRRITDALRDAPGDGRDLAAWASLAGATPRTIIRLFARETGMTFREWRRQLRVLRALELLGEGVPVTSVALELGYGGPSAFIQAFRDVLGVTPARYFAS